MPLSLFRFESRWINLRLNEMNKGLQELGRATVITRERELKIKIDQMKLSQQLGSIAADAKKACEGVTSGCP